MKILYFSLIACGIAGVFLGMAGFVITLIWMTPIGAGISISGLVILMIGMLGVVICQFVDA